MKRIIIYIGLILVFVALVQWKKMNVIEQRTKEVVSIPGEIKSHGWPVDIEQVKQDELYKSMRVSVIPGSLRHKKISFYISREEVRKVKPGQVVKNSINNKKIGKVKTVSKTPDLSTGLYKSDVLLDQAIDNKQERIPTVDIITKSIKNIISVPIESVDSSYKEDTHYLWLFQDGVAKPVEVSLGVKGHARVAILAGLNTGDQVVINGYKALQEGYKLRPRKCKNCTDVNKEVEL